MTADLHALRDDVELLDGNDVAVRRSVAQLRRSDVLVLVDLRRYDRWVIDAARAAHNRGVWNEKNQPEWLIWDRKVSIRKRSSSGLRLIEEREEM